MPALPTADWLAALDEMDAAVSAALAGVEGREGERTEIPHATGAPGPLVGPEARLAGWDDRLAAAGRLAERLEQDFAARAGALERWRQAFSDWRAGIQQPADTPSA
ncbi:MAG TPA: hypothetical protein VH092_12680 [Urbifossiella sp.]|jgi:hypothetical protein|nr:hypothetical protein [Urbifossiella sp.]